MNNKFQKYKASFRIGVTEVTTEGVQQAEIYTPQQEEYIYIPVYDFTEEQYQKHLEKRRRQELDKLRWKKEER